jgi:hypothetical protein
MTKEELGKFAFDRFIAGAKSDTARDYWYSKFKQELGQEVGQVVQVERMYSEEDMGKAIIFAFDTFSEALSRREMELRANEFIQSLYIKKQDALNLDELESKLDNSLSKETTESLFEWLISKRVDDDLTDDEWLIKEKHKETLEFGEWLLASEIEYVDNTTEGNIYMIFGYLDYSGVGLKMKDLREIYLKQNNKLWKKQKNY